MSFSQERYNIRSKTHHAAGANIKHLVQGSTGLGDHLKEMPTHNKKDTIYIHVPFCTKICTFCNMRRSIVEPPSGYGDLVEEQIKRFSQYQSIQDKSFDSIYFGGGTPTTLPAEDLRKILRALKNNLPISQEAEISVETTVTELSQKKMEMFYEEGVNRFSIGVQTFSDTGRNTLGRRGNSGLVVNKINQLLGMGFSNINIDMIYNYPDQSIEEIYKDIEIASSLDIAGFSFYSLILNDQSQLIKRVKDAEGYYDDNFKREVEGFKIITDQAKKRGFDFLELTKMVRSTRDDYKYIKIRHGGGDTLPLGAGAGGNIGDLSLMNEINMEKFSHQVKNLGKTKGMLFKPEYALIKEISAMPQFTKVDLGKVEDEGLRNHLRAFFEELAFEGFVVKDSRLYRLTDKGIFWGNNICREVSEVVIDHLASAQNKVC